MCALKIVCPSARVRKRKNMKSHTCILQMRERRFLQQVQLIRTLNKTPVDFPDNFIFLSE